ncbi:MAG: hypothetical protein ACOYN0_12120 [Phycisphaerales bacterium]
MNRTTLSAVLLVALAGSGHALAQRQPGGMPRGFPRMMMDLDEEGGYRGRGSRGDAPPVKSPLGMLLMQQDYTRVPEGVLAARSTLETKARDARLKPKEAKEPSEAPKAEPEHAPDTDPTDPSKAAAPDAEPDAGPDAPREPSPEEIELAEEFRLRVVAGDWTGVATILRDKLGEDGPGVFAFVLQALQSDQALVPGEIISVSEASPGDLRDADVDVLARLLRGSVSRGADPSHLALTIRNGTKSFGGSDPANRARAARLLMGADLPVEAQPFLDPLEGALKDRNARLINLHVMYFDGLAKREKRAEDQQKASRRAWELCLEVLRIADAPTTERASAGSRALGYLAGVTSEEADSFLGAMFASEPDVAWNLLNTATQKARVSRMQQMPPEARITNLKTLKRLGESLVTRAESQVPTYRTALNMMALTILDEAEDTKRRRQDERFRFIPPEQLGEVLPGTAWLLAGDPGLASKLEVMSASVSSGAGEYESVLAVIRPLVSTDKPRALRLAESLVGSWSGTPAAPQYDEEGMYYGGPSYASRYRGYNPYGGGYPGYNPYGGGYGGGGYGAEGAIPLTRARQERQVSQLAGVLKELRSMDLAVPTASLTAAFTSSHSQAEVFREQDIERCFGPMNALDAEVAMSLAGTMRRNLATTWRQQQAQQQAQTRRNDQQISAEVERGYKLATALAERGRGSTSEAWKSALMRADLAFDRSEFLYGKGGDLTEYGALRASAFAQYAEAAESYREAFLSGATQPSAQVYFQWMSSALGASDLGSLTRQDKPAEEQVALVINALDELPEPKRALHIAQFADSVNNAVNTIAPELKVRFLTHACAVLGDAPAAASSRKLLSYYNELKTEVEVVLTVDGPTDVGSRRPFGAQLAIRCTGAVSRETGGFSKYTQNDQYNPMTGQPVQYRDDLEKKLRETLAERFDVLSVTFHKPGVPPVGSGAEGWEEHGLAYLVLKAKDASVDRIPPVQMDLDFSDGRGIVIMPKSTSAQLINCRTEPPTAAIEDLEITQTLDDREASKGILKLEVIAKGKGLIPPFTDIFGATPIGFVEKSNTDNGPQVQELDTTTQKTRPICERNWTLEFAPAPGAQPTEFSFPVTAAAHKTLTLKRYTDADIVDAQATVPVTIATPKPQRLLWLGGVGVALGAVALVALLRPRKPKTVYTPTFVVPADLTPVGAVALLRRIGAAGLGDNERRELAAAVSGIERTYFAPGASSDGVGDSLRVEVTKWVALAEGRMRR